MGIIRAMKLLLFLALGLALLATAGCFGSNRNFSSSPGSSTGSASQPSSSQPITASSGQVGVRPGNTAPDFALKDLEGKSVRLSEYRGKPVLVNIWATWCPPCKEEMPAMEAAYKRYKDEGFVFLGIDMKEDAATVQKFVKENGYSWVFLMDQDGKVSRDYQVTGIPESFFIDRDGIVRDRVIGAMTPAILESKLAKIK